MLPLPPPVRGPAGRDPWGGLLPDALPPRVRPGGPPLLGGALRLGNSRDGDGVLLRLYPGLRVLPEPPHQPANFGKPLTEDELYAAFQRLADQGASCIELVTPTQFTHVLARVLERPVPGGLPVVWNSGGYERPDVLKTLEGRVDVYLPDLKYVTPSLAERYSGAADYPEAAKAAILEMFRQRGTARLENGLLKSGVLIRHLVLPGQVNEAKRVMDWVADTFPSGAVLFSLMAQYTPAGELGGFPELQRPLRPSELRAAKMYMENLGLAGYVQELGSCGERFIPAFDLTGL